MSKLTIELHEHLKISNSWEMARLGGARVWVSYSRMHAHAHGTRDPRAIVLRWNNDRRTYEDAQVLKVPMGFSGTGTQVRDKAFELALEWISTQAYKQTEWKRTPFNDAMVPLPVYDKIMTKLEEAKTTSQA